MLTQHPHVVRRLREEILNTVGPNDMPTFGQMKEMKYLRAFVNGSSHFLCPFAHRVTPLKQKL